MNEPWYYEYTIKFYDEIDDKMETRSGIIPADCLVSVINELEEFYGNIIEIQTLKCLTEGIVFDFNDAKECKDFDYIINKKR